MHEPFYRGWHVFRQIPSYEDAAKGLTANRWKPLQTQDVFWVASALALWWQDFGLSYFKTYLNGACTTLPLLAARKGMIYMIDAWLKEDMKWQSFSLTLSINSACKEQQFQFKSIFDLQLWLWSVLSIAGWNARVYIVVICGEE